MSFVDGCCVRTRKFNFEDADRIVSAFRPKALDYAERMNVRLKASLAVEAFDLLSIGETPKDDFAEYNSSMTPVAWANTVMDCHRYEIKAAGWRDPMYDLFCDLYFYTASGKALILPIVEEATKYRAMLLDIDRIEEYGWWRSDVIPRTGITNKAWAQRESDWESASNGRTPYRVEIIKSLDLSCGGTSTKRIGKSMIPPFERRVWDCALKKALGTRVRELVERRPTQSGYGLRDDETESFSRDAHKWVSTEDGLSYRKSEEKRISKILRQDLKPKELFGFSTAKASR